MDSPPLIVLEIVTDPQKLNDIIHHHHAEAGKNVRKIKNFLFFDIPVAASLK